MLDRGIALGVRGGSYPSVRLRLLIVGFAEQFATIEASYVTTRLVQEFKSMEPRDREPWTECLGVTCSSANGVKVGIIPSATL